MAKKEKLNVKVVTAPNGYALDIGCHGFFYFTIEELLKGFIYHVGFKELGEVSMDKISGIVGAAASWKDNAEVMEQVIALEHEIQNLKLALSAMDQDIGKKKEQAKILREKLADKNKRIKEMEEVLKEHPNWLRKK